MKIALCKCGHKATLWGSRILGWTIFCRNCGSKLSEYQVCRPKRVAVERWNEWMLNPSELYCVVVMKDKDGNELYRTWSKDLYRQYPNAASIEIRLLENAITTVGKLSKEFVPLNKRCFFGKH